MTRLPYPVLWLGGLVNPLLRETTYQFDRPYVLDSSATQQALGIEPTALEEALAETLRALRRDPGVSSAKRSS